ncbi:MAG: plasmid stabilization protein [Planctomycetes bacterium RBG_16_55_9]|nr:MAG: plasmid stabilization protein [Planctomycetes bacterium RBG_16_55_9]
MKKIRFLDPAEQEMLDAAHYYESQAVGLGEDFLSKVENAVRDVAAHPDMWPVIRLDIRRRLVHRFPYGILYKIDDEEIVVVAVAHLRRHPSYWIGRI